MHSLIKSKNQNKGQYCYQSIDSHRNPRARRSAYAANGRE